MVDRTLHEENRLSWNEATKAHNSHKGDQAAFFRAGGTTLYPEDIALLGDVTGKRVVHLQCNSGQDTLSIAKLGAGSVTGVDISDEAIAFAQRLALDAEIPATFVRADVYDWLAEAAERGEQFDIVFCSYGWNIWLSDLAEWSRGVAKVLAPGGRLVALEFHPFIAMYETDWSMQYDYFGNGQALTWDEGVSDYVADSGDAQTMGPAEEGIVGFKNPNRAHEFTWTIADLLSGLIGAGLVLETFEEYPFANGWKARDNCREFPGRRFYPPETLPSLPMMFGLTAKEPKQKRSRPSERVPA